MMLLFYIAFKGKEMNKTKAILIVAESDPPFLSEYDKAESCR